MDANRPVHLPMCTTCNTQEMNFGLSRSEWGKSPKPRSRNLFGYEVRVYFVPTMAAPNLLNEVHPDCATNQKGVDEIAHQLLIFHRRLKAIL